MTFQPKPLDDGYQEVDFVALGHAQNAEQSRRMNAIRQESHKMVRWMIEQSSELAELPTCFQTTIAALIMVGAQPNHLVLNEASDGTRYLFGTAKASEEGGCQIFQAKAPPGVVDDLSVTMRIVGPPLPTLEEALTCLLYVQTAITIDPDFAHHVNDHLSVGSNLLH
jgi:hypothetical protein